MRHVPYAALIFILNGNIHFKCSNRKFFIVASVRYESICVRLSNNEKIVIDFSDFQVPNHSSNGNIL